MENKRDRLIKSKIENDALSELDDIEEIDTMLSEREMRLLNNIFSDLNEFTRIVDNIDEAISEGIIDSREVKLMNRSIMKLVKHRSKIRMISKESKARWFFELPEMIREKYLHSAKRACV